MIQSFLSLQVFGLLKNVCPFQSGSKNDIYNLSTSIYDLVLIYVCHFHHHHHHHPLRVSQILPLSRYSCCYLGSLHPRNFEIILHEFQFYFLIQIFLYGNEYVSRTDNSIQIVSSSLHVWVFNFNLQFEMSSWKMVKISVSRIGVETVPNGFKLQVIFNLSHCFEEGKSYSSALFQAKHPEINYIY